MRSNDRHRRAPVILATALCLALIAGSCKKADTNYDNVATPSIGVNTPGSTTSTTAPPPAYTATYENDPSCKVDNLPSRLSADPGKPPPADCGFLTVPEDRRHPKSTTLRLQVVRIRATGPTPRPDPYVYLEGGPGGSALAGLRWLLGSFKTLTEDRDLIIMDQRGTGYSDPIISCAYDRARATSDLEYVDIFKKCHARLKDSRFKLESYTTKENAADFADLRKALKIDSWNLFGVSYGTRLALEMMADQPEGIRSVVIDSVYPGGVNAFAEFSPNAVRSIQAVFAACAADATCGKANPDLESGLAAIIENLNNKPLKDTNPFKNDTSKRLQVNGDKFLRYVFQQLYSSEEIYYLPSLITAGRKEPQRAGELLGRYSVRAPGAGSSYDFSEGFFYTVQCAEFGQVLDQPTIEASVAPVNPIVRDSLIRNTLEDYQICKDWNVPPSPVAEPTAAIPTLVLAGSFDPITPPSWAQRAKNLLPTSRYVEVEGSGHGVYFVGDCESKLVKTFLNEPTTAVTATDGCPKITKFYSRYRP